MEIIQSSAVLVLVVAAILFPPAFVWYLAFSGIYVALKEARAKRVAKKKGVPVTVR